MFHLDPRNPERFDAPGGVRSFRFTTQSLFNTLMVDGATRYATNTVAGVTTLWRVLGTTELKDIARIIWPSADGARHVVIELSDQHITAEELLTKPKRGMFRNSTSRYFHAGARRLKWSERDLDWMQRKKFVCFDVTDSDDTSSEASVVANLIPPCPGVARPSLSLSVTADDVLERILLTAIVMVGQDTWRSIRQAMSQDELVEHLASHAPSVYRDGHGRRVSAQAGRRPRTADQSGPSESEVTLVPWMQPPPAHSSESLATLVAP